jgi:voltage-gated potassium channel
MEHHTIESAIEAIRRFRALAGSALLVIIAGMFFYHFVEDLGWINSVYFCVMTLATVGYGDFTPQTDAGKIFTVLYVLIGIGILGAFANNLLKGNMARRFLKTQDPAEVQAEIDRQMPRKR